MPRVILPRLLLASQQSRDPPVEVREVEWFGEDVAHLPSGELPVVLPGRHEQHRDSFRIGIAAELVEDGEAIQAGEVDVEDDEVGPYLAEEFQGFCAVAHDGCGPAGFVAQGGRDQLGDSDGIFHDDDGLRVHASP